MSILETITIATSTQLRDAGAHPRDIMAAVDQGLIFRVAPGLYVSPAIYVDPMLDDALACRRHDAVIGCLTAAARHGLCDAMPPQTEVLVPATAGRPSPGLPLRYIRSRNPDTLTVGVDVEDFYGMPIRMTNPARTVIDLYRIDPQAIRQHSAAALARYIGTGGDMQQLNEYALHFGMWEILRPEVEIAQEAFKGGYAP